MGPSFRKCNWDAEARQESSSTNASGTKFHGQKAAVMARVTGLEPATSGVTGRRSNQLSYTRKGNVRGSWDKGQTPDCQRPGPLVQPFPSASPPEA
jgi:hypothetical protein